MDERLFYAVPADLRSKAAHCVHTVKMGRALRSVFDNVLICVRFAPSEGEITRRYGVENPFQVIETGKNGFGFPSLRFAVATLCRTSRFDIIYTRNLLTAFLSVIARRTTLLELHSPLLSRRDRLLFNIYLCSPYCRGLIVITSALKYRFVSDFGQKIEARCHVLPDAADPVDTCTRHVGQFSTVGYIGSFLPGKGVDLILRVAALLPDVRFEIVGGTTTDLSPNQIIPSNVYLIGVLSHADAVAKLAEFDVVLLPNQKRVLVSNDRVDIGAWTSPLKLFEYMAAGKPIVASRIEVLKEILTDGENALLANPLCPIEWAEKISTIFSDHNLARRIGEKANRDFKNHYTWAARAQKIADILRRKNLK